MSTVLATNHWRCSICSDNPAMQDGAEMTQHLERVHGIKRDQVEYHAHEWYVKEAQSE